jgi:hypothetical protein
MSKKEACDFEREAVCAAKTEIFGDNFADHLKNCPACGETIKLVRFFQRDLVREMPPRRLPAAGLIWFKSRLREKHRVAETIAKPILINQTAAAILAVGTFIWLMWGRSQNFPLLDQALNRVLGSMEQILFPLVIGITALTFICCLLIFALRRLLLEK